MIKIDLITGFLGSGKTTFLKQYAKYLMAQGKNIGILENDFGAVNVDMLLLQELRGDQCELEMISGGCDKETHRRRFRTKLISMGMSGYDRILVEPSGIYDVDEFSCGCSPGTYGTTFLTFFSQLLISSFLSACGQEMHPDFIPSFCFFGKPCES